MVGSLPSLSFEDIDALLKKADEKYPEHQVLAGVEFAVSGITYVIVTGKRIESPDWKLRAVVPPEKLWTEICDDKECSEYLAAVMNESFERSNVAVVELKKTFTKTLTNIECVHLFVITKMCL